MESHGSITVYTGPMFSGKTQALMARLQSKERAHRKVLVVKPELDDRFHSLSEIVSKQRTAQKFEKHASMKAYPIKSAQDLGPLIRELDPDVVGVDEAQFFDDAIGRVLDLIAHQPGGRIGDVEIGRSLEVYAAGLDLDAWAQAVRAHAEPPRVCRSRGEVHRQLFSVRPGRAVDAENRGFVRTNRGWRRRAVRGALRRLLDGADAVVRGSWLGARCP